MRKSNAYRVRIHILSEYVRMIDEHSLKSSQHELDKLSENLILFAEVCPVIYFGNVRKQMMNLAGYYRKRLTEQHIYVMERLMHYLQDRGIIDDVTELVRVAYTLDNREWHDKEDGVDQKTRELRDQARCQYETILPHYDALIQKLYPKSSISEQTHFRVLQIDGDQEPTSTPISSFNTKEIEKEFENRSQWVSIKPKPTPLKHTRPSHYHRRHHGNRNAIVRPTYGYTRLTHQALMEYENHGPDGFTRGSQDPEFWGWPFQNTYRRPPFTGRKALSDGGFELEDTTAYSNRPGRALSDDAGPTYQFQEETFRNYDHHDMHDPDNFIPPNFQNDSYIRYTPSPPPVDNDPVFTLTDQGFSLAHGAHQDEQHGSFWRDAFANSGHM